MLYETPDDTYRAYTKFMKKGEYKKAYRCLEKMLHEFPDDIELMEEIIDLCIYHWDRPDYGEKWLRALIKIRSHWLDYLLLSHVEAELEHIDLAKAYLEIAKKLEKTEHRGKTDSNTKKAISETENFIKLKELNISVWREDHGAAKNIVEEKTRKKDNRDGTEKSSLSRSEEKGRRGRSQIAGSHSPAVKDNVVKEKKLSSVREDVIHIPYYTIPIKKTPINNEKFSSLLRCGISTLKEARMLIEYTHLTIQSGFDDLLCLNAITGVEKYWYQVETVKKVLKHFHGRVLLCDEVGLGKTIEAGMLIKEYLMRGMIRNVLILTPSPLVSQWAEEMACKFGIVFLTTDDPEFVRDQANFWKQPFLIASINTAKSAKNMPLIIEQFYDLLVVDEAHHLRNKATLSWKLVNQIKKRFIFLLTATPVQNNLVELFNLITLLKPGQFKTEREFKKEYVKKGSLKESANKERLRELLREVMIRNTRSVIDLKLPKRYATTIRLTPTDLEKEIYIKVDEYLKKKNPNKMICHLLLREAGSSPFALKYSLLRMDDKDGPGDIIDAIDSLEDFSKGRTLIELLRKDQAEKKIIFTQFIKSMDYITEILLREGIPFVTFRGDMTSEEKNVSITRFKNEIPVLVSTESGGEGRNLQFCNTIINFDLPWNPMRIEQRIGRLHRIGQTRDVFIFNLSVKDTIEDYIIDILDSKINMFEMVIGEIEPILGHLGDDRDFEDIIMEIWVKSSDRQGLREGFERLGSDLMKAKGEYLRTKAVAEEIFGEDYET